MTMKDVAAAVGVSVASVSNAYNRPEKLSEDVRARILATGAEPELAGVALVVGAGAGLIMADLQERLMLGDAGANVLGAALGLGVVLACSPGVRTGVLVVVALLNLASERVSFSRVINAVPPLRAFDRIGRLP